MSEPAPGDLFSECHCTGVTRSQVLAAVAAGCRTVNELRSCIGVCGGCGTCRPDLEALLRNIVAKADPPASRS
jgi:nitrite reductase (NADH) large subunit